MLVTLLCHHAPSLGFRLQIRPRRRAAARPSKVRSDASAPSNSAMDLSIWKNIRPAAVEVSIPGPRQDLGLAAPHGGAATNQLPARASARPEVNVGAAI